MLSFVPVQNTPEDFAIFEKLEEGFYKHYTALGIGTQYGRLPFDEVPKELTRSEFDRYLNGNDEPESCFLFVTKDSEVIGYLCGWIKNKSGWYRKPRIAHLESLFLTESERGKGYSSEMAQHFFQWAKARQVDICQLEVFAKNTDAVSVYKKWGFEVDEMILWKPL